MWRREQVVDAHTTMSSKTDHAVDLRVSGVSLHVLKDVSLQFSAGSLNVILGPSKSGKSTLLRVLSGERQPAAGKVEPGNKPLQQYRAARPFDIGACGQDDIHLGTLTVRETLLFVARCAGVVEASARVEEVARITGLTECLDTLVGDARIRGISGGQKRRLTLAEALIPFPRILLLDSFTTGLDAATSLRLMTWLQSYCTDSGATVVAALLSPAPELLALADRVVCMQRGRVVWCGPPAAMVPHFASLGHPIPPAQEAAHAVVDILANERNDITPAVMPTTETNVEPASQQMQLQTVHAPRYAQFGAVLRRQSLLIARSKGSALLRLLQAAVVGALLAGLFWRPPSERFALKISVVLFAAFMIGFNNLPEVAAAVVTRAVTAKHTHAGLLSPAAASIASIIAQLPLLAVETLILGNLIYWPVDFNPDGGRYFFFLLALFLCSCTIAAYFRMLAVVFPSAAAAEGVAAVSLASWVLWSGFIITYQRIADWLTPLYWVSPFAWLLRSVCHNEFLASDGPYSTPPPGIPASSGLTSGIIYMNTFEIQQEPAYKWAGIGYLAGATLVYLALTTLALQHGTTLQAAQETVIHWLAGKLSNQQGEAVRGAGAAAGAAAVAVTVSPAVAVDATQAATNGAKSATAPPPVAVLLEEIRYVIQVANNSVGASRFGACSRRRTVLSGSASPPSTAATTIPRVLLDGISMSFAPGSLTAICGATGAGKTTLGEVIMGFKSTSTTSGSSSGSSSGGGGGGGSVTGRISVNGLQVPSLAAVAGFAQQDDCHLPGITIREALAFAAYSRMPPGTPAAARAEHVAAVLQLLSLTPAADRPPRTPAERKLLTLAIELAASPSVIVCDEPTSGLSSGDAVTVVAALRAVASSGRTVIATIHAPTYPVFVSFDALLLLAPGGRVVYRGDIGPEAATLVAHLHSMPHVPRLPPGKNPASWALEVVDLACQQPQQLDDMVEKAAAQGTHGIATSDSGDGRSGGDAALTVTVTTAVPRRGATCCRSLALFGRLLQRNLKQQYRQPRLIATRLGTQLVIGVLLGLLYLNLSTTYVGGLQSKMAFTFIALAFLGLANFTTSLPYLFSVRPALMRENRSGMYPLGLHNLSVLVGEAPLVILSTLLFAIITAYMVGMRTADDALSLWVGSCILIGLCYHAQAVAAASLLPTPTVAQTLFFALQALAVLTGGLFLPWPAMPAGMHWSMEANPLFHASSSVWSSQLYCDDTNYAGPACPSFLIPPLPFPVSLWSFAADWLGLVYADRAYHLGATAGFYVGFFVLALLASAVKHHRR